MSNRLAEERKVYRSLFGQHYPIDPSLYRTQILSVSIPSTNKRRISRLVTLDFDTSPGRNRKRRKIGLAHDSHTIVPLPGKRHAIKGGFCWHCVTVEHRESPNLAQPGSTTCGEHESIVRLCGNCKQQPSGNRLICEACRRNRKRSLPISRAKRGSNSSSSSQEEASAVSQSQLPLEIARELVTTLQRSIDTLNEKVTLLLERMDSSSS